MGLAKQSVWVFLYLMEYMCMCAFLLCYKFLHLQNRDKSFSSYVAGKTKYVKYLEQCHAYNECLVNLNYSDWALLSLYEGHLVWEPVYCSDPNVNNFYSSFNSTVLVKQWNTHGIHLEYMHTIHIHTHTIANSHVRLFTFMFKLIAIIQKFRIQALSHTSHRSSAQ